jgi:hypothetical protein
MRPMEDRERVRALKVAGHNRSSIERMTGISRATQRYWELPHVARPYTESCPACGLAPHDFDALPARAYAYLLGIYLGDGMIAKVGRTLALRVFMDSRYPILIGQVVGAMQQVMSDRLAGVYPSQSENMVIITSHGKAWPCLLPQHGPGKKHTRKIELELWQAGIVASHPEQLVRGLIDSDGCRVINRVTISGKEYRYPRYFFTQVSDDIRGIFCAALDQLGVEYRFSSRGRDVTIHRRRSVAVLDELVGPKR